MVARYFVLQAIQGFDIGHITCCSGRLLSHGKFYIKHNFGEYLPTFDELCEILHSNSYTSLIRKIHY